jgi:6-phosphofructokinase 1
MGRDARHIALNAGIGAEQKEILIPEENLGLDRIIRIFTKKVKLQEKSSIVVIAEGDKIGKKCIRIKRLR